MLPGVIIMVIMLLLKQLIVFEIRIVNKYAAKLLLEVVFLLLILKVKLLKYFLVLFMLSNILTALRDVERWTWLDWFH